MENDIKKRLKERMKERKIKTPELSKLVKIPKDRIYAWYRDDTTPKAEDMAKIEQWINEEIFNKESSESKIFGEFEERLITIEAQNEVFEATLAGLLASDALDFVKKQGELREAIQVAVRRRFDELSKK